MEICWGSIPGCGNSQCKDPEVKVCLEASIARELGEIRLAGTGVQWGPGRALSRGTAVVVPDLVLGKLRALAFDLQLYLDYLSERDPAANSQMT